MKRFILALLTIFIFTPYVLSAKPPQRQRFYDFGDQLINGEIKKPTAIFLDVRERAKFDRLLKLKKSFLPNLFKTSKNKVFK